MYLPPDSLVIFTGFYYIKRKSYSQFYLILFIYSLLTAVPGIYSDKKRANRLLLRTQEAIRPLLLTHIFPYGAAWISSISPLNSASGYPYGRIK